MSAITEAAHNEFAWEIQPAAARWVRSALDTLAAFNPNIGRLADVLLDFTGTRLVDWLDHLTLDVEALPELVGQLVDIGYVPDYDRLGGLAASVGNVSARADRYRKHRRRLAMRINRAGSRAASGSTRAAAVDPGQVIGADGGDFRMVSIDTHVAGQISLFERHGYPSFSFRAVGADQIRAARRHAETFCRRQRAWNTPDEGFAHASQLFANAAADLGHRMGLRFVFRRGTRLLAEPQPRRASAI